MEAEIVTIAVEVDDGAASITVNLECGTDLNAAPAKIGRAQLIAEILAHRGRDLLDLSIGQLQAKHLAQFRV